MTTEYSHYLDEKRYITRAYVRRGRTLRRGLQPQGREREVPHGVRWVAYPPGGDGGTVGGSCAPSSAQRSADPSAVPLCR